MNAESKLLKGRPNRLIHAPSKGSLISILHHFFFFSFPLQLIKIVFVTNNLHLFCLSFPKL